MKLLTTILSAAVLLLATACVSMQSIKVVLAPGEQVELPPAALPKPHAPLYREQMLQAEAQGRTHSIHTVLNADGETITLVGLSSMGLRLFKVVYSSKEIKVEHLPVAEGLPPAAQVLSDIMMAYWPLETWMRVLPKGWQLVDESPDLRKLVDPQGEVVTEIRYELFGSRREPVSVRQIPFQYKISIKTLATSPEADDNP